jgi:hypothetical protein
MKSTPWPNGMQCSKLVGEKNSSIEEERKKEKKNEAKQKKKLVLNLQVF